MVLAHERFNRVEKVLSLFRLLALSRYPVPLKILQEELDCTRSTLHRVRRQLEAFCGEPIVYHEKARGYHFACGRAPHTPLPGLCLSAQELSAFVCVEQILEGLHQGFLSSMVGPFRKKIQLLLDANDLESEQWRRRIKIVPLASRSVVPAVFETVVQGLLGRNQLEFCYQGISNSVAEVRIVSPQTVLRYKDNWYLDGWCHTRGALRTFALSRINEVALTAVPSFEIDCALLQSHYEQTYGIFDGPHTDDAVIRFTGTAALIVSQECWHPHQQVLKTGPQEHVLKLPFGNARELCMDILRWGDEAEVLEPQAFREEMKKIIKNMQNVYACRKNCNTG